MVTETVGEDDHCKASGAEKLDLQASEFGLPIDNDNGFGNDYRLPV